MTENNIPYVILKGLASASYYPNAHMRNQGDVDFLVNVNDSDRVKQILFDDGFKYIEETPNETVYEKNGVSFEIHRAVNGVPAGAKCDTVKEYLRDIILEAKCTYIDNNALMLPNVYYHGLVILLHTAKHMVGFGLGLRQICDWAAFTNYVGEDFPKIFEDSLEKMGLWKFALSLSAACVKFLKLPEYSWIPKFSDDFLNEFMDDLTYKGNLHHDDDDREDYIFYAEGNEGGIGEKNIFYHIFKCISDAVICKWSFFRKYKILIPIGIIIISLQYLIGLITGKYNINFAVTIKNANKRKKLYKEVGLFDIGN